jgi:hypothetical protein
MKDQAMVLSPRFALVVSALCLAGAGALAVWSSAIHRRARETDLSPAARAELRALIRQEISAGPRPTPPDTTAPADSASQPAAPLEGPQRAAYDAGAKLVGAALGRKKWSDDDARKLRELVDGLPAAHRIKLVEPLIIALNSDQVRFEGEGPPL